MYGRKDEPRPLEDGELDKILSRQLSSSTLRRLAEARLCVNAKGPDEGPEDAPFHVLIVETVTPVTGWESEGGHGRLTPFWRLFCFPEESMNTWLALATAYFEQRSAAAGDKMRVPEPMVFLNRGKKLIPRVQVSVS